jgi:hypothetical protein
MRKGFLIHQFPAYLIDHDQLYELNSVRQIDRDQVYEWNFVGQIDRDQVYEWNPVCQFVHDHSFLSFLEAIFDL